MVVVVVGAKLGVDLGAVWSYCSPQLKPIFPSSFILVIRLKL